MYLIDTETETKERREAEILPLRVGEFWTVKTSGRFPDFDWDTERKNEVVKIMIKGSSEILGLMSLIDIPSQICIKINLLQSSKENVHKNKKYDRIAGCLIAYACDQAFIKKYDGTVMLKPKGKLVDHYIEEYGFRPFGIHLILEQPHSYNIVKKYLLL